MNDEPAQEKQQRPKSIADVPASIRKEAAELLDSAISKLIVFRPLYGTVFVFLNKIQRADLPTMGVGTTRSVDLALYYNPEFVITLNQIELRAVLQHEALHILLHHIVRSQHFGYNPKGYNIAADLAINCNIEGLPKFALFPKAFGLDNYQSSEWYYEKLKKEAEDKQKSIGDIGEGKGELVDDHSMWGDCDGDVIKEKIRNVADKAIKAQESKGWGDVPGNIAQAVIAANKPVVNWQKELRFFINRVVQMGKRSTRMRPNRRFGYVNPGSKKDYKSKLLIAMDTSGSISDHDLETFVSETNGMIDHVECHVIMFDTQLYGKPKLFDRKVKKLQVEGRGGTDFHPVFELAEESAYDGLIILSDGFAVIPPKPRVRVLWAMTKSGADNQFPYGKKIVIDIKQKN